MTWDGRASDVAYAAITGTTQPIGDNTTTQVTFNTAEESIPTGFAATSTDRLIIPAPGVYLIEGHLEFEANATGRRNMSLLVNGVPVKHVGLPVLASVVAYLSVVHYRRLDVGDLITLTVLQTSGAGLDSNGRRLAAIRLAL